MELTGLLRSEKVCRELIQRNPLAAPPLPPNGSSLAAMLLTALETRAAQPAIIDGISGTITSRQQLKEQILSAAGWFSQKIARGEVVSVSLPNIPQFLVPAIGAIHAGGVCSLMNPVYTPAETQHGLQITKPKVVVTSPISLPALQATTVGSHSCVLVGGDLPDATPFSSLLASPHLTAGVKPASMDDPALLPFSSGTTGLPKAICLSHRNTVVYHTVTQMPSFGTMGPGKNMLCLLPMFHMYGFTMTVTALLKGATVTTLPRFQLESLLSAVQNYRVTHLPIVPPVAAVLAKHPDVSKYDLSSVEFVDCAAAPLSGPLQRALSGRLGVDTIRNGYGLSETVAAAIIPVPELAAELMRKGSVGIPIPGIEVRIVDPVSGVEQGPNKEGEICVRGPTVMTGYLGDAGATAATLDADGWLHTGDLGKYDDQGLFYVTDRLKELIKYKAWQVAPAELESVLLGLEGVADAGVVGVPGEEGEGELPRAFVVLKEGSALTEEDIKNHVKVNCAAYKQLRGGVVFLPAIPRSLAGKILRKELRKL